MQSHKLSAISSIALITVLFIITIFAIAIVSHSPGFLFVLAVVFLICSIQAFFTTFIQEQKGKVSSTVLERVFVDKEHNARPDEEKLDVNELREKTETETNEYETNDQNDNPLSLRDYLNRNNHFLNDEILHAIEWKRFELLCHRIFKAMGYNSELTGDGADQGVDIRIFDTASPRKTLYLIQCKKWRGNQKISRENIQQLRGQMATENVEKGGYCSTARFSLPARDYAKKNSIELFDQKTIIKSFNKLNKSDREYILRKVLDGNYWTPSCASCGEKFDPIKQRNGKMIWGCKNYWGHGWSKIPYYEARPIKKVIN